MFRYIKSQAQNTSKVLDKLDDSTKPCMCAIIQLWLFPQYKEYHHHWSHEVWSSLNSVQKLRSTNKYPKQKVIFKETFEDNKHLIKVCINEMIYKENELTPDETRLFSKDTLEEKLEQYFLWISDYLSRNGIVENDLIVRDKLIELEIM